MSIELTDEQVQLKKEMIQWYKHFGQGKPYYYYSGAAGTGKTTVIQSFIEDLGLGAEEVISCAYVGKAVLVLLRRGLNASTIHSLIYIPKITTTNEYELDEFGSPILKKKKKMEFCLKDRLSPNLKLIVVDERGMVNDKILNDILSFGIPVVLTGDHNQLAPVFGKATNLDSPDFILTKIMRQAEGNPIVYLSQCILKDIPLECGIYGKSEVVERKEIDSSVMTDYDILLCGKNATRDRLNDTIRQDILGYKDRKPVLGDKLICRKNDKSEENHGIFLTNGLMGTIIDINYSSLYRGVLYLDLLPDFMEYPFQKLSVDYDYLIADYPERKEKGFGHDLQRFEYGYAITTHLSQGSEWSRVLYMDEYMHDEETMRRLRYTAITRAVDSITYVKSPQKKKKYNYFGFSYEL